MKLRKQSNAVYFCEYHLVFPTKYRRKILNEGIFAYLKDILEKIKDYYPQIHILEINHDKDHIHLLVSIPPKLSVGTVVRVIKANTARMLKKKFGHLTGIYWGTEAIWSEGYYVSTVGVNEKIIQQYIKQQGEEDFGQAELELSR
ncbi:IS200/IS605 family transposase [Patescibacteria group bacterium]|nr:IS200/IS605 family transposase [Patescibacteria group bacterium]